MSESECEISDFSQTCEPDEEEMEEEDDNVQVIFSQIEPLAGGTMVSLVGTASFFRQQFILTHAWGLHAAEHGQVFLIT